MTNEQRACEICNAWLMKDKSLKSDTLLPLITAALDEKDKEIAEWKKRLVDETGFLVKRLDHYMKIADL